MSLTAGVYTVIQLVLALVVGLYVWTLLKSQRGNKSAVERESRKELDKIRRLREVSLTPPLSEKTRPTHMEEIIGQAEGIRTLRAALCGPNPQHVIIYGPPGIGKTAAARLVLEEAKGNPLSPFRESAKFTEIDATVTRFDERGIADPLIGSVHDPIYQGAGAMGVAGIPQPKPGAVTKAHGGILFIDEIGELHPTQMNKLLKVLEDRKVFLESAYYTPEDPNIPRHIQDIFENGLPADFRLVGATTRLAQEIAPALRSRCLEIFFRPLNAEEVGRIAENAAGKIGGSVTPEALDLIKRYAGSGREAVNMVQLAAGFSLSRGQRVQIKLEDIEWIINTGQYAPRPRGKAGDRPQCGVVNGLAVAGPSEGLLLEVEVTAHRVTKGAGRLNVTGVIEEEEMKGLGGRSMRRKSTARSSVENVMTVLRRHLDVDVRDYDLHVNFPGGVPVEGPSAGTAIATAVYSAVTNRPVDNQVAMTGEISIRGLVRPVGGVKAKIDAAVQAGLKKVLIPKDNWQEIFRAVDGIQVIPVTDLEEIFREAILVERVKEQATFVPLEVPAELPASASGLGG